MYRLQNRSKGPIQVIVRSATRSNGFTTLFIPGVGSGRNVLEIADERYTDYIDRIAAQKLISVEYLEDKVKGE